MGKSGRQLEVSFWSSMEKLGEGVKILELSEYGGYLNLRRVDETT